MKSSRRERKPAGDAFIKQTVNLADRSDVDRISPSSGEIVDKNLDTWNGVAFVSDRFLKPTELSGLFYGRLDFKQPEVQINYGTGKDVSDETIADAKEPLNIQWFDDSFIDVPVWR